MENNWKTKAFANVDRCVAGIHFIVGVIVHGSANLYEGEDNWRADEGFIDRLEFDEVVGVTGTSDDAESWAAFLCDAALRMHDKLQDKQAAAAGASWKTGYHTACDLLWQLSGAGRLVDLRVRPEEQASLEEALIIAAVEERAYAQEQAQMDEGVTRG